jgi:hypothetical protein|nr:MAG TPA: Avd-like protein [Caudoviricetes sp.]
MLASELPVYRDTFELVNILIDYVAIFPKAHKYTIGQKMINTALELFEYLQLANRAADNKPARTKYLEGFLIKFELLKVLLRICNEKRIITVKQAARLATYTEKIGRQVTGWKNK